MSWMHCHGTVRCMEESIYIYIRTPTTSKDKKLSSVFCGLAFSSKSQTAHSTGPIQRTSPPFVCKSIASMAFRWNAAQRTLFAMLVQAGKSCAIILKQTQRPVRRSVSIAQLSC